MKLEVSDRSLISEAPYLIVKVPGGRMHTYGGLDQNEWNLKLLIDPLLVNTPYLITKLPGDPENSLIGINAPYLMVKVCLEGDCVIMEDRTRIAVGHETLIAF